MWFLVVFVFLISIPVGVYFWLRHKVISHIPANYPDPAKRLSDRPVVVCAGDSITHGNTGANYVDLLAHRHLNLQFFNAGRNADLTYTLLDRFDDVILMDPDLVTVLIGTNDVNATMSKDRLVEYRKIGRIGPDITPDFAQFQQNYRQLIDRLKTETNAQVAVASLPVMGEDLTHEANHRADQYSAFIKELAEQEGLTYLPVREAMKTYLANYPPIRRYRYEQARLLLTGSVAQHYLLGESWDQICARHGNQLTQDMLHFNSVGATIIADAIDRFLSSVFCPPSSVASLNPSTLSAEATENGGQKTEN